MTYLVSLRFGPDIPPAAVERTQGALGTLGLQVLLDPRSDLRGRLYVADPEQADVDEAGAEFASDAVFAQAQETVRRIRRNLGLKR